MPMDNNYHQCYYTHVPTFLILPCPCASSVNVLECYHVCHLHILVHRAVSGDKGREDGDRRCRVPKREEEEEEDE